MKKWIRWETGILALAVFALGLQAASSKTPGRTKLVVIVKSGGVLAGLDSKDIQAIFLGDKQFQGGDKIEPLVNGDGQLNDLFLRKILNKTKAQYKKIWSGKAFIDGISAPSVLPSSGDVVREVEKNPDAVGFVSDQDVSGDHAIKVVYSVDLTP